MEKKKLTRKEKFSVPREPKPNHYKVRNTFWLPALILAAIAAALYINTLGHEFTLDDYSVILENRVTKQGFSAIPEILKTSYRFGYYFTSDNLYRPLVKAMFAAEWGMSPNNAFPGHVMNVLFYAITAIVIFGTLRQMTGNILLSFIASALFIAHPIHTEVVANIKSRDEILAFLFCMMALYFFISFLKNKKTSDSILSAFLYFAAFLSKESSITFLAVFPLAGWCFTDRKLTDIFKSMLLPVSAAVLFLLIRASVLGTTVPESVSVADNLLMAAKDGITRFCTAVLILGLYLKLLVFPHPLVFDYSFNQIPLVGPGDFGFIISALAYIGMLVFAVWKLKEKNIFSFAILFYLFTISVSSNLFITIGSSMGERFIYAPSFGFCIALAALICLVIKTNSDPGFSFSKLISENKKIFIVLLILLIPYSLKTIARNPVWKNNYTLYSNDVLLSPNSTRTHYYLGNYLVKPEAWEGKTEQEKKQIIYNGIDELQKSVAIYPGFADAFTQLGVAYSKLGKPDSSLFFYQKALTLNPGYPTIHNNIGTVFFEQQKYDEALRYFLKAVELDPRYSEAHANAGSAYGMMKQYDNALNSLFNAIKWDPNYSQAYYFIGITYRFKGDETNANIYLEKAYRLDPSLRPAK